MTGTSIVVRSLEDIEFEMLVVGIQEIQSHDFRSSQAADADRYARPTKGLRVYLRAESCPCFKLSDLRMDKDI